MNAPGAWTRPTAPITSRNVYAAAHVVPQMAAENTPGSPATLDWEATLGYRHELWSWGLGVADAMDTAQRGMGLDWAATQELIARSCAEATSVVHAAPAALRGKSVRDLISCGVGTDQLQPDSLQPGIAGLDAVKAAYLEQLEVVEAAGAKTIIMCSRDLARVARNAEDYLGIYTELLEQSSRPVILHWLGTMFDPALEGYWGSTDVAVATATFLELIASNPSKVDGVKVSLLDAGHETQLRAALPAGVRLYTGDDFNYPELIRGDGQRHSDALLGIFAAIYPAASTALQAFDAGDAERGYQILASTQKLGRHIFSTPTFYYKTGIAFLAWLNGHQSGFQLVGGLHSGRSLPHLAKTFALADEAGLLRDPDLAARRMGALLTTGGFN
ncbi:dihydrodipicolinate synthase family protein [Paeniglutamicibacter sp. ABSL32-1]|uniref:dihydrodipicolinate synthase family protein n=1 Tax=Paeniglutamicibacter quisquiliarum TaxID=2849498 RepID=UPI001C2D0778|nr:dihydrodipicolinate synthase family protein [Paeniglutamicibacter quisquiliarum]MBV1777722.1 dihydrodipicolinate synthase family protein [Paeniglutamicibacter quisquiliarum]